MLSDVLLFAISFLGVGLFISGAVKMCSARGKPVQWVLVAIEDASSFESVGCGDASGKSYGFQSVRWLPPPDVTDTDTQAASGELVMPVLPLRQVYFPGSKHVLDIFEPRYRDLHDDVISSGSRCFVVPLIQPASGNVDKIPQKAGDMAVSEVGVLFVVNHCQRVSEEAGKGHRYLCKHEVLKRVRIRRLLNPLAVLDRQRYLRAAVEDLVDADQDGDYSVEEAELSELFREVVRLQHQLDGLEKVRISRDAAAPGNLMTRGDGGAFWESAAAWQTLFRRRWLEKNASLGLAEQALVRSWHRERNLEVPNMAGQGMPLTALPRDLQGQCRRLQKQFQDEASGLLAQHLWFSQALVQADRHGTRLQMLGD
eukprot:EG_transcript_14113